MNGLFFAKARALVCAGLILTAGANFAAAQEGIAPGVPVPANRNVIVQLFNWRFNDIKDALPRLKQFGYSHIHVSPPQQSNERIWQWWGRYQPIDFSVINGPLGTEAEFKSMNQAADAQDMKIVVDVVLNHTIDVNEAPSPDFVVFNGDTIVSEKFPQFNPDDFHHRCNINDGDINSVRQCWLSGALADLKTESPHVRQIAHDYLQKLKDLGVDGFRFDAAKHIEPDFFNTVLADFAGEYSFGEAIVGDAGQIPQVNALDFYDFPLAATMHRAFGFGGDLRELLHAQEQNHALPGPKAVTFVRNHDIDRGENSDRGLDPGSLDFFSVGWNGATHTSNRDDVMLAYAFILGREEGFPYVFVDMNTLPPQNQDDRFDNPQLAAFIRFHNLCLAGQDGVDRRPDIVRVETPNALGWQRGTDRFVVINKAAEPFSIRDLATSLKPGRYKEVHQGWALDVAADGKIAEWNVPGRSAMMFVPAQ